jgi:hypothetical protein
MAVLHRSSTPFERRQVACRLVVIAHPQPDTLDKERTEASTPPRKRKIRDPSASSSTPPQRQLSPSTIFPILSYTFVSISTYPHILHFSIIITNQHIRAQPSQGIQDRSRHMHISRFLGKKHNSLGICTLRQERNELNYLDRRAPRFGWQSCGNHCIGTQVCSGVCTAFGIGMWRSCGDVSGDATARGWCEG